MRKWKFIEQELINLKAPEKLIAYSKILNKIELELNVNWEQKEFDYFSNLIKENKLPIYKILLNSIFTDFKCVTCTNDKEFYPLKHYDCKNKLSEKYQKRCGEMEQEIITWLRSQISEKPAHIFCDCLNQPLIIGDYILFSHGRYGILEVGKINAITSYNITVSTTFKERKNKFSTTLCRENNIILINKDLLSDETRILLGD